MCVLWVAEIKYVRMYVCSAVYALVTLYLWCLCVRLSQVGIISTVSSRRDMHSETENQPQWGLQCRWGGQKLSCVFWWFVKFFCYNSRCETINKGF